MGYFPEILVPIVIFFGITVVLGSGISAVGVNSMKND